MVLVKHREQRSHSATVLATAEEQLFDSISDDSTATTGTSLSAIM